MRWDIECQPSQKRGKRHIRRNLSKMADLTIDEIKIYLTLKFDSVTCIVLDYAPMPYPTPYKKIYVYRIYTNPDRTLLGESCFNERNAWKEAYNNNV